MRGLALLLVPALLAACGFDRREPEPGKVAGLADDALRGLIQGGATEAEIAYRIFDLRDLTLDDELDPARCDLVDARLQTLCADLQAAGQAQSCSQVTAFYYAHVVPRCAVRFVTTSEPGDPMPRIYALDFTGTPLTGPEPLCGNGAVDPGEQCDDGNLELWDGCDSTCQTEEFEGCETLIEERFAAAELATVDATTWEGKRSQLMVNQATALQPVTATTCATAGAIARGVCQDLVAQMPFVGSCQPRSQLIDADGAAGCAVRFEVWFHGRAPDAGVFTTALTGQLAFTIR